MPRTDIASRVVRADPSRVFTALVTAEQLERWLPPAGMTGRFEHLDARTGGSYRLVLAYRSGTAGAGKTTPGSDVVAARFLEVVPGDRVVQAVDFVSEDPSFAGTMTMTWAVAEHPEGTEVTITAVDVPPGISPEDHQVGMCSSLAQLAALLEPPAELS